MEIDKTIIDPDSNSVEEVVEKSTPNSKSRTWMQARYPDVEWENDDAYDESLFNHLEESDRVLNDYRENDKTIGEILEMYPEFALVLEDIGNGVPLRIALERNIGLDELTPDEKDADYESFMETRTKRLEDSRKFNEDYNMRRTNAEKSNERFSAFVEDQENWDDAKKQGFVSFVQDFLAALGRGEFSDSNFQMLADAYTHDEDVADAAETGKIEGRNENITSRRIKREASTDGIPDGGGANPAPSTPRQRRKQVIDLGAALNLTEEELEERRKQFS
uniref:hypothetical protein n=1 Tax=Alistipes sp. TaxID=1872444 RepID=UPI004056C80A